MLRLQPSLDNEHLPKLKKWQESVDTEVSFDAKAAKAKKTWRNKNKIGNTVFEAIKEALTASCAGARRCMYCEDSFADEVEHVHPKDLYPTLCFSWDNYLYACGPCNGPKNNHFAVFGPNEKVVDIGGRRTKPLQAPQAGKEVFIDPRSENPMDLLDLDMAKTFRYVPRAPDKTVEHSRAEYTIRLLHLNERKLPAARRQTFRYLRRTLKSYVRAKEADPNDPEVTDAREDIESCPHPTVWEELKRQRVALGLETWFERAPELGGLVAGKPTG